jgi:hypothetical protein
MANTTPLTYNGYINQIATMAVVNTTTTNGVVQGVDAAFNAIIPQMLNYAELRIQRDMDLLPSQTSRSYSIPAATNTLQISVDDFVTLQTIQVMPLNGSPTTVLPVSKEYLQAVFNSPTTTGIPIYFAMTGGDLSTGGSTFNYIQFGPYSDQTYTATVYGTIRVPTLYNFANTTQANTSTTFISTYLPDMLIMASMVYISAFQRNFGRMSDDPAMAQSYEGQYQSMKNAAAIEEYRKKFQGSAWSSMSVPQGATPTR